MTKLNEEGIETFAIELLQSQGYEHIYAPDIAPESERPERSSCQDFFLEARLAEAIVRINPSIPGEAQQEALKAVKRIHSLNLLDKLLSSLMSVRLKCNQQDITNIGDYYE